MSSTAAKRVVVEFPEQLLDRAERATQELSISRSELVRQAVEQFIESSDRAKLEKELAEGYQANTQLDRSIAEEFAAVDYDTF
jgi:metal-responsive CopG/Arc/MetJ family transcriptional regulator